MVTWFRAARANSPRIAQLVRGKDFAIRGVYRVGPLTARADYRMARVALVRAHVFDERINVPSTIGAVIPEFGHVVSILKLRAGV